MKSERPSNVSACSRFRKQTETFDFYLPMSLLVNVRQGRSKPIDLGLQIFDKLCVVGVSYKA